MNGWLSYEQAETEIRTRSKKIALMAAEANRANAEANRANAQAEEASTGAELNRVEKELVLERTEGEYQENRVKRVQGNIAVETEEEAVHLFKSQVDEAEGDAKQSQWKGDNPVWDRILPGAPGAIATVSTRGRNYKGKGKAKGN